MKALRYLSFGILGTYIWCGLCTITLSFWDPSFWRGTFIAMGFSIGWAFFHRFVEKQIEDGYLSIVTTRQRFYIALIGNLLVFGLLLFFGLGDLAIATYTLSSTILWIVLPIGSVVLLCFAGLISFIAQRDNRKLLHP